MRRLLALLAVTLMVGGCRGAHDPAPPGEVHSLPSHADTDPPPFQGPDADARARAIVASRSAHIFAFDVSRADVAVVWSQGYHYGRPTAIAVRLAEGGTEVHLGPPSIFALDPVPGGWEATADLAGASADVYRRLRIDRHARVRFLKRHALAPERNPPGHRSDACLRRPGRDVFCVPQTRHRLVVIHIHDGRTVSSTVVARDHRIVAGGAIAGAGRHLAIVAGGPADGDAGTFQGLSTSDDGGDTWATSFLPRPEVELLGLAVTDSGTTFATTGSGHLLRVRPGHGVEILSGRRPTAVVADGDVVYSLTSNARRTRYTIDRSTDQGRTWQSMPAPGRE